MAKKRTTADNDAPPLLAAALICERVLQETDNVLSLIRVVDTVTLPPEPVPAKDELVGLPLSVLLLFKTGDARGKRQILVTLVKPSGAKEPAVLVEYDFGSPEEGGHNVHMPVRLKWEQEGLYHFDVVLGGTQLTRIPLRVKFATLLASRTKRQRQTGLTHSRK
jgi:hypothetical protein